MTYLSDGVSIDIEGILRRDTCICDHLQSHRGEDLVLPWTIVLLVSALVTTVLVVAAETTCASSTIVVVAVSALRSEESWIVISELCT